MRESFTSVLKAFYLLCLRAISAGTDCCCWWDATKVDWLVDDLAEKVRRAEEADGHYAQKLSLIHI